MNDYDYLNDINYNNDYIQNNNDYVGKDNNKINSYIGFIRGNIFDDLYEPYMNMKPAELNPSNEREALMNQIQEYGFVAHDLNLYLDNHPNNKDAINLFNDYNKMCKTSTLQYEKLYGPIYVNYEGTNPDFWDWDNEPWPWGGIR